jgi:peptide/nickel transport system substrate-binding protein
MNDSHWQRMRQRRVGRRPLIGAGLVAGAAFAASCSSSNNGKSTSATAASTSSTPAARQPKRGGSLRYAKIAVLGMDPATSSPEPLWNSVYEWLGVWKQSEGTAIPHLARTWEQPDPATIIFRMHPAATWQDKAPVAGRKVTSQDVKYTIGYYNSPEPSFQWKSEFGFVDHNRIETPDAGTITLRLKQPFLPQLTSLLTSNKLYILPQEVVERDGNLDKEAIGTGAFQVDSYVQNGAVRLVRNPKYWKAGLPYIDEQQLLPVKDQTSQLSAFSTGNLEMLEHFPVDQLKELPKTAQVLKAGLWVWSGLRFNVTRKPFDDVRVRRALHLAIDRDALNQIAWDGNSEPSAAVPPVYGKFALPKDELLKQPGYRKPKDEDLAEAKKLLDAAGVKDLASTAVGVSGQKSSIQVPTEAIVDQLAKIGVKVTPNIMDAPNYVRVRVAGDFTLLTDSQAGGGDPDLLLRQAYYTGASRNYGKYSNSQVDALIDKQAQEPDVDRRTQILYELQRLLLTDMPVAVEFYTVELTVVQPYVQGLAEWVGPSFATNYHALGQSVWLDK